MESAIINPLICGICQKEFTSVSIKNRHLRKIHNEDIQKDKNQHILCCLCPAEKRDKFSTYKTYENHLKIIHNVLVKETNFYFRSSEEFESWRGQENREVDYASVRNWKTMKGDTIVYYNCNRSNYRGYKSVCEKRKRKVGGSIHIQGVCPSRITVKISTDGLYTVTFVETHVGHDDVLRLKAKSSKKTKHFMQEIQHNDEETRKIALEEFTGFINQQSGDDLQKFLSEVWKLKSRMNKDMQICKKKKVEKQS